MTFKTTAKTFKNRDMQRAALALAGKHAGGWPETKQALQRLEGYLPGKWARSYTVEQFLEAVYEIDGNGVWRTRLDILELFPGNKVYSFDLARFNEGRFAATRYPSGCAVGGDWVCVAPSDEEALKLAQKASYDEWAAPEGRLHNDFTVEFFDSKPPYRKPCDLGGE